MKQQITQMQKDKSLAIKIILFCAFSLLSISMFSQSDKEDYILLNKIATHFFDTKDTIVEIKCKSDFSFHEIKKYYRHQYLKEKNIINIIGYKYDEKGKQIPDYYTPEIQNKFQREMFAKYEFLSKKFTRKDFELFLNKKHQKWNKTKFSNKNLKLICSRKESKNSIFISRPYYSLDKKYALIQYSNKKFNLYTIILKKDENQWVFSNIIKNIL